jgi:endoglucanase
MKSSLCMTGALAVILGGCAVDPESLTMTPEPIGPVTPVGPEMTGLHVVGSHIENAAGATVQIHGVNRSGTEYQCVHGAGIFDGPSNSASVAMMAAWKANAVRIPLNEDCWLAINGVSSTYAGDAYKQAIRDYVSLLEMFHIIPIVELHWVGPGAVQASRQQPMPDADHAPAFWADVAATFAGDDAVILEPYNEPYPDGNKDSDAAWTCWRDGCVANQAVAKGQPAITYQAVGMQALVDAIRTARATNVLLLGGVQYSNALSQWLAYQPVDPLHNLAAAWHAYNFNACKAADCWDTVLAGVLAQVPLVATELGENDCGSTFIDPLLTWLDGHGGGYLAWSWNAYGACQPAVNNQGGQPWSLILNYATASPNGGYAQAYHDHLVGL